MEFKQIIIITSSLKSAFPLIIVHLVSFTDIDLNPDVFPCIYIYAIFCRFKTRKAIVFFSVHFLLIDRYFVWKGYSMGYITTTLYRHAVHWI